MPGNYTWDERNTGGRKIGSWVKYKACLTIKLSCTKAGKNIRPFIIWKASGFPIDQQPWSNTVAYEINKGVKDNYSNEYPPDDKIIMTFSPTVSSNGKLTKKILHNFIFPDIGIIEGIRGGVLFGDFTCHHTDIVKKFNQSYQNE